jgi:hypothetical protein
MLAWELAISSLLLKCCLCALRKLFTCTITQTETSRFSFTYTFLKNINYETLRLSTPNHLLSLITFSERKFSNSSNKKSKPRSRIRIPHQDPKQATKPACLPVTGTGYIFKAWPVTGRPGRLPRQARQARPKRQAAWPV